MTVAAPDLSTEGLVKAFHVEAEAKWKELEKDTKPDAPVKHSGPQGHVEPFTIIDDPAAWYAEQYKDPETYAFYFSDADIAEIEAAIEHAESLNIEQQGNLLLIQDKVPTQKEFPLPTLGPKLEAIIEEVRAGRGFALLRGLPVDRWTRRQVLIAYWGLALYWGNIVSQNAKGHIIGHVKNIATNPNDLNTRPYTTSQGQAPHVDGSDVVGLLCLKQAKEGGLSSWASSITAHNEILRRGRRDLAEVLAQRGVWFFDRKGEIPPGEEPYLEQPIFNYHEGYLSVAFISKIYELSQRHADLPRLTDKQREATAVFGALVNSDLLRLDLNLSPGDIQLVYNHNLVHTRSGFTDDEDVNNRRHLLRLWLSPRVDRPLPDVYKWSGPNSSVKPGFRGGIEVHTSLTVPLEAE
eukprot:jgi/Botrbrau1/22463/Bobra.0091s0065.1